MVHLVVTAQNVFALSYLVTEEDGRGTKLKKKIEAQRASEGGKGSGKFKSGGGWVGT